MVFECQWLEEPFYLNYFSVEKIFKKHHLINKYLEMDYLH